MTFKGQLHCHVYNSAFYLNYNFFLLTRRHVMWFKQFPGHGHDMDSKSSPKFAAPLKPKLDNYSAKFNPNILNNGHQGHLHTGPLDPAAAITLLNVNSNTSSKFRIKLDLHSQKISTIAGISKDSKRNGSSLSECNLNTDDESDVEGKEEDCDKNSGDNNYRISRFEFLFRIFINLGYSICLIPFFLVPVTIGHKVYYEVRHHTLQRIVSAFQCSTASVVVFFVAYAQIGGQNIENNPLVIFNFWSYSVFCSWCFLFTNIFWRKEHLILAIVNRDPQNISDSVPTGNGLSFPQNLDEWIATIYFYGVVLEEIYHKSVFYLFPKVYGLQSAAETYSGKAMYSLFARNNSKPIPWAEITPTTLGVSIWHFVGWQSFGAIKSLFYIFVTFCSLFLIGRINRELRDVRKLTTMANFDPHHHGGSPSSRQIWSHFVEIRSVLGQINELTDLCILGIYLILVPFLSSAFIRRWDSDFIEYKILMVLQFVWPMISLIAASEATRLGEKFLRSVKDGSDDIRRSIGSGEEITHCSAYYVYENADFSLKGGKFFNVSYGFMGSTLSVVMTYGLVILGFLHDAQSSKSKC